MMPIKNTIKKQQQAVKQMTEQMIKDIKAINMLMKIDLRNARKEK